MTPQDAAFELELSREVAACYGDPLRFCLTMFDWNRLGEGATLRKWQRDFLDILGMEVRRRGFNGTKPVMPIMFTTRSGHGVGKTALVAMIILWLMSTRPKCRISITANTAQQLSARTWAELGKYMELCLTSHWFTLLSNPGNLMLKARDGEREGEQVSSQWFCRGFSPTKELSEAFAGQHAADSSSVYIFDEASAIPEIFFEVMRGGLTDGEPFVFCFGNGTRNTGAFYQSHVNPGEEWMTFHIPSTSVEGINQEQFEQWRALWGVDSDFWRVRVAGMFPEKGESQFIPTELVDRAQTVPDVAGEGGLVFGVDVARLGTNQSVIYPRRGRDARKAGLIEVLSKADGNEVGARVAHRIVREQPYQVYVDGGGVGASVIDYLKREGFGPVVTEVNSARKAPEPNIVNMRAYMYHRLLQGLRGRMALPKIGRGEADIGTRLRNELLAQEKVYRKTDDALGLVPKEDLIRLNADSCDVSDALALTFAGADTDDRARHADWHAMNDFPDVARERVRGALFGGGVDIGERLWSH